MQLTQTIFSKKEKRKKNGEKYNARSPKNTCQKKYIKCLTYHLQKKSPKVQKMDTFQDLKLYEKSLKSHGAF